MASALTRIRKGSKQALSAAVARAAVARLDRRPRTMAEVAALAPRRIVAIRSDRVGDLLVYDPRPTLAAVLERRAAGDPVGTIAAAFHETIASVTEELVSAAARETGLRVVALSGGVLQNQRLAGTLADRLERDGFAVHLNRRIPANDGGISYGQAAVAAARLAAKGTGSPASPAAGASPGRRDR